MINWFKNIKYYKFYKSVIREKEVELSSKFRLRRDMVNRLYTVVNMSDGGDIQNDIRNYGSKLTQTYLTDYVKKVDSYFYNLGLNELIAIQRMEKIDELNYLIVFCFPLFDTVKVLRNKIILSIMFVLSLISSLIIFF